MELGRVDFLSDHIEWAYDITTNPFKEVTFFQRQKYLPIIAEGNSCKDKIANLHFGSNEERGDSNELQSGFQYVCLCGHETVKVLLGQIKGFPV